MPPPPKPKHEAPDKDAPVEEHRRHAEEVLLDEDYAEPPPDFQEETDEANP